MFLFIDLRRIFQDADDDASGSIDKKEFKKLIKKLNCFPGDKEFETMFRDVDRDGESHIIFFSLSVILKSTIQLCLSKYMLSVRDNFPHDLISFDVNS